MPNIYLQVNFKEKEIAKSRGARWDNEVKKWYVPHGLDTLNFYKWLPENTLENNIIVTSEQPTEPQCITLSQLLQKVTNAIQNIEPQLMWVRAEVSEIFLHATTANCYLELIEMHDNKLLCKVKAMITKKDYPSLLDKFKQVTGDFLKPGMQILLLAKLNFSIQYGFSLYIKDLDPAYTIGDLAAKLALIRETLKKDGLYEQNKKLVAVVDFTRVAVLSPNAAAGLGDFKREASILASYGLCDFHYYTAQFQGTETAKSMAASLNQIFLDHKELDFDVVVIIRGGGAVIDLAWLNDYQIAKLICASPIVIYSGIGHERDNTIIDEIAGVRFDTPSKVIAHIFNAIVYNAKHAIGHAEEIKNLAKLIHLNIFNSMIEQLNNTLKISELNILKIQQNTEKQYINILTSSQSFLQLTTTLTKQHYLRIFEHNILNLKHLDAKLAEYMQNIHTTLPHSLTFSVKELELLWSGLVFKLHDEYSNYQLIIEQILKHLHEQTTMQRDQTSQIIKELITNIISLGPKATLGRGYSIIRNQFNRTISSKRQSEHCQSMQIEFYDGIIKVTREQ